MENDINLVSPKNIGFTLIEILIALAILAGSFLALIKMSGGYTYQVAYLRDKTYAHWVAENKLTENALQPWPAIGKTEGFLGMGNKDWFWEQQVINTPDPAIRRIEVRVKHKKDSKTYLVTLIGFAGQSQNQKKEVVEH